MKTFFKITISLVTLVFTVILVAALYVFNWDPNENKDWIAGKFEGSTGRKLGMEGEIGLTLYPWLGITVENISIGNAPGFSDTPLLRADRAEFRVKLLPIMKREYEIDTIRLTGARVSLETNAAGENNWSSLSGESGGGTASTESAEPAFNKLLIGGVDIRDAAVTFDDRFNGVRYDLNNITVSTGELVYGEPVDLFLGFNAAASRPALSAMVNLTGRVLYDLDNRHYELAPLNITSTLSGNNVPGGSADITLTTAVAFDPGEELVTLRDFSLTALDAQINANVNGSGVLGPAPLYQINLAAAGNDLAVLFRILENEELASRIAGLSSTAFSVNGLVEVSPARGNVTVTGLDASLLDAAITGDIDAENLQSGTPVLRGTINASGPDLPTLVEVAGQLQGGRNSPLAQYGRELQQAPNQDFLLNTDFDADLASGNVNVPSFQTRLFGTTVTGNIAASNVNTDTPVVRGQLTANGPDLPLMMQIAGQLSGGRESPLNRYGRQLRGVSNKSFNVNAPFDANLSTGNIDLRGIEASFLGFRLDGNLTARNFQDAGGTMSGRVNLSGRNLAQVLRAVDQPDLAEVLQSLTLAVSVDGTRSNLTVSPLNLDLVLSGPRIPNSPVTLALNADSVLNLEGETLRTDKFSLAGLGLNLSGSVNADNIMSNISYSGQVSLPRFNLRRFMQQLNQSLPPTMDNTVFQALALNTRFAGSTDDIRLDNIDLTLDESRFTGNFTLAGFANPAVDFTLNISRINLDRYLAPEAGTPAASAEVGNTELPVDALRELNLKGQLNIGQITYSNLHLNNVAMGLNASDGQVALAPISAGLYQGSYNGDIRLNVNGDMPVASVDTSLQGVNLAPMLQDFMQANYVSGTGTIALSLTGRGADTATIKRNLNGSGSLELKDGILRGVDVGSVLGQVETMIRNQRPASVARGEQTPFKTFTANIDVKNGIVSTNDLLIDSSGFSVTGKGTLANLTNDTIAFNLVANVDKTPASGEQQYDIGGYSLPIACTGALNGPRCLPDIEAILAGAITSALQRGLTNLLERATGGQQQQQTTPQDDAAPADQEEQPQEEETDPREELINRALESIFKR